MRLEFVTLTVDGPVATIMLNRPARKNALHPAAHHEMQRLLDRLAGDESLRCLILTGAGPDFCTGYDLKDNLESGVLEVAAGGFAGLSFRTDYPLPIVAAVNGMALGGGFEAALACDVIVASTTARFGLPEARVGWSPLGGGLQRLPRAVGEKRAASLVLSGRTIDAAEAERWGLVAEIVPPEELLNAARRWAEAITAGAPLAVACNREVMMRAWAMPLDQAMDIRHFPSATRVLSSDDAIEGKRAFVERRAPVWRNR